MTLVSSKIETATRKNWIDWMKVIGITAVVWGHFFPEGMSDFIYAFNVPVFFAISGYLTNPNRGMCESARKVATSLIVPYLLLALLKVAGYVVRHIDDGKALWSLLFVVTGVHDYDGISGCNNLWFVYTLIIIKLLFPAIRKRPAVIVAIAIACLVGGKFYADLDVPVAWAVPDVLLAFPFFALGYLVNPNNHEYPNPSPSPREGMFSYLRTAVVALVYVIRHPFPWGRAWVRTSMAWVRTFRAWVVLLFFALLTYAVSSFNGEVHMFSAHYGNNIFLFVIAALSGTAMVYALSKLLDNVRLRGVRTISSGTIVILTFHRELVHPLSKLFGKLDMGTVTHNIAIFAASVAIVIVFIPVIMLLERYAPILLGKRK